MIIHILEPEEIHPEAIKKLRFNNVKVIIKKKINPEERKNISAIFIRTYTAADKKLLENYPNLKYILRAGVGLDNINLDECKKRNIKIFNSPGSNANAVAEYVTGLIIMLLRNFQIQSNRLRNGQWRDKQFIGGELKGKTVGLVGCGAIGKLLTRKLIGLEIKEILGYDPYLDKETMLKNNIRKCELNYLIKNSDIISLHLPLTSETRNIISLKEMKTMKKDSFIINTSRGGIINEIDLIEALKKGIIKGAALDVFENEPKVLHELLELDNLLVTPHIAGYTENADKEMSIMPAEALLKMSE